MLGYYESLHPTGAFGGVLFSISVSFLSLSMFSLGFTILQLVSLAIRVRNMGGT